MKYQIVQYLIKDLTILWKMTPDAQCDLTQFDLTKDYGSFTQVSDPI